MESFNLLRRHYATARKTDQTYNTSLYASGVSKGKKIIHMLLFLLKISSRSSQTKMEVFKVDNGRRPRSRAVPYVPRYLMMAPFFRRCAPNILRQLVQLLHLLQKRRRLLGRSQAWWCKTHTVKVQ